MAKKTGIMGGTFNPIHFGHLLLAEQAKEFLDLDEVIFIPSGNSYMKAALHIPDPQTRMDMTALAIDGHPYFRLSSIEADRKGPSYTCDTLAELREKDPSSEYYFIVGADILFSMETWKDPEQIFQGCTLVVAVRGTETPDTVQKKAAELTERFKAHIRILPSRIVDLSSTQIRKRISEGKPVCYMLPERVLNYIDAHQLYQDI